MFHCKKLAVKMMNGENCQARRAQASLSKNQFLECLYCTDYYRGDTVITDEPEEGEEVIENTPEAPLSPLPEAVAEPKKEEPEVEEPEMKPPEPKKEIAAGEVIPAKDPDEIIDAEDSEDSPPLKVTADIRRKKRGPYKRNRAVPTKEQKKEAEEKKEAYRKEAYEIIGRMDSGKVTLDFKEYPELLEKIRALAKTNIRTVELQILYLIKTFPEA